jgi:hypothetical protein
MTMHPRMLAKDGCSGGTCPAVYALDGMPGDLVIQGVEADADLLGSLDGVAPNETAVIISREVIERAIAQLAGGGQAGRNVA